MGVLMFKRCSGRHIVLLAVLCFTKIYESQSVCSGTVFFTRVRCFSDFKNTTFKEYTSFDIPFDACADMCAWDSMCTFFFFDGHAETPICVLHQQESPVVQTFPQKQKYFMMFEQEDVCGPLLPEYFVDSTDKDPPFEFDVVRPF